jgi:hypothetical protein
MYDEYDALGLAWACRCAGPRGATTSCFARPSPAVGAGPLPLTAGAGGRA